MRNVAFAVHPERIDAAVRRAKAALRLLEREPCARPKAGKERKWPIPEPVQVAMLLAMHPEMEGARIRKLLREGRLELPKRRYHLEEVRKAAVLALVEYLGKRPIEVSDEDFEGNGLGWLANRQGSSFRALREAGLLSCEDGHAYRFKKKPETFGSRDNRVRALREAAEAMGKGPSETRLRDLKGRFPGTYSMVINYYGGSLFEAYLDAGLVTGKDEAHMRARGTKPH
ncbi:MAG TPA: hypothetical protein PKJ97_00675 [Candidatus Bilamarchaeaceae archaeon]|nr:hypothetical protein [Candidatus Bilamarchaeaceae archaeon]